MAWGPILKGIGKVAGGLIGIGGGGDGGKFDKILDAITAGSTVASGLAGGRAKGRVDEAGINQNQDLVRLQAARLLEDALQSRSRTGLDTDALKLQASRFLEDALGTRAHYGLNRDSLRQRGAEFGENAMQNRAGLDLQRRQFALNAPGQRATNAVRGDTLANAQDATVSGVRIPIPQISGGLRPSMFSGDTRKLGSEMSRHALMQQMEGDKFDALPPISMPEVSNFDFGAMPTAPKIGDYSMPAPQIPGITPTPQAGKWDSILNTVGTIGGFAGALNDVRKKNKKPTVPPIPTPSYAWNNVRF